MKIKLYQWCLFALLIGFAFMLQNCQEEELIALDENQITTELGSKKIKKVKNKVDVCHYDAKKDTWHLINISTNAVAKHVANHGDVYYGQDDDEDGYFKKSACEELGNPRQDVLWDCDDSDNTIYPGAPEIAGDGIDNDCDGAIDVTYVPDDNFEHYLETHDENKNIVSIGDENSMGDGIDGNDYVPTANINTITSLDVSYRDITDLTGIKDFTALTDLQCHHNQLADLDLKDNTALIILNCSRNGITSLNVSANTALTDLSCVKNNLTSLDVSANTALTYLKCGINSLTSLDVSLNTALNFLRCSSNNITSLDVSANTALTTLWTDTNPFGSLNVSNNTALTYLSCKNNDLNSLDVSNITFLVDFNCENNPDLTCIQVNLSQLPVPPSWVSDSGVYLEDCNY